MKIALTADLHGNLPEIPECDLLLIAGDICPLWNHSIEYQWEWLEHEFNDWLKSVPAEFIVGIAGNHDFIAERYSDVLYGLPWLYLQDETTEYEDLLIYGSPWTPQFFNWAFMKEDDELAEKWAQIPDEVDILITHGPPFGICDLSLYQRNHAGSITLKDALSRFKQLKIHVFGHIHEGAGIERVDLGRKEQRIFVNASLVNRDYEPVNPIRVIDL